MDMIYRNLGHTGTRVSIFSYGAYISFGNQMDLGAVKECMQAAYEGGVNLFDNADAYADGMSEKLMGDAISSLGWRRESFVMSTKVFFGAVRGVNTTRSLSRKNLLYAVDASLERLQTGFVDIVLCHRDDPSTPLEETVRAMHTIVESGRALYWGTSEWPVDRIEAALLIAEKYGLHRPVTEQLEYNLLVRHKVEDEYGPMIEKSLSGVMTWAPLAAGLLSGKYLDGVPQGSRASRLGADPMSSSAAQRLGVSIDDAKSKNSVRALVDAARGYGVSPAQLALAWCATNPRVSTVITGATNPEQVVQNVDALKLIHDHGDKLRPDLDAVISNSGTASL